MKNWYPIVKLVRFVCVSGMCTAALGATSLHAETRLNWCPPDITYDDVTVYEGYYISNNGTCALSSQTILLNNGGSILNSGTMTNNGRVWNEIGTLKNDGSETSLINMPGAYIYNTGYFFDTGVERFIVKGDFFNQNGAQILNLGIFSNNGESFSGVGGLLTNTGSGTIFINADGGIFFNNFEGTNFTNKNGATIINTSNYNPEKFTNFVNGNGAELVNSGFGTNIINKDLGIFQNSDNAIVENRDGATFTNQNYAIFENSLGAYLSNTGYGTNLLNNHLLKQVGFEIAD